MNLDPLGDILTAHGYDIADYGIDLNVLSESNQVIIIHDHKRSQLIKLPVEDNVLTWSQGRIAEAIVEALDSDQMRDHGYV